MASRADSPPSAAELSAWVAVASPRTARGRFRWTPPEPDWNVSVGWAGSGPPVMACVPDDVELAFWHAAPGSWRVEGPAGLVCTSDGRTAVVHRTDDIQVGGHLIMGVGPDGLLHPSDGRSRRRLQQPDTSGTVAADELLGRPCWRWAAAERTLWVDDQTGCALRLDDADGSRELTAFEVDVEVDPALFAPPDGVTLPREERSARPAGPPPPRPTAGFTVAWWPQGAPGHPIEGDASVPELLLELHTASDDAPRFWLGVAPAGVPARVRRGSRVRRWDGDGWAFALSWRGELPDEDVEQVVASIPRAWELSS